MSKTGDTLLTSDRMCIPATPGIEVFLNGNDRIAITNTTADGEAVGYIVEIDARTADKVCEWIRQCAAELMAEAGAT